MAEAVAGAESEPVGRMLNPTRRSSQKARSRANAGLRPFAHLTAAKPCDRVREDGQASAGRTPPYAPLAQCLPKRHSSNARALLIAGRAVTSA